MTELCEVNNIGYDPDEFKNAIVYDPYPKYMYDIKEDYEEDFEALKEKSKIGLKMRNMLSSNEEEVMSPKTLNEKMRLNAPSPEATPKTLREGLASEDMSKEMDSEGSASEIRNSTREGREDSAFTGTRSNKAASPGNSPGVKKKKKRNRKRKLPAYPDAGVYLKTWEDYDIEDVPKKKKR